MHEALVNEAVSLIIQNKVKNRKIVVLKIRNSNQRLRAAFQREEKFGFEVCYEDKELLATLAQKSVLYYVVIDGKYTEDIDGLMRRYGYEEMKDFLFCVPKEIVLQGRTSKYQDERGNCIENLPSNIKISLTGYGSKIYFGEKVLFGRESSMRIGSFANIRCATNSRFGERTQIELLDGGSIIIEKITFGGSSGGRAIIACGEKGRMKIGKESSYGTDNELIANAYHTLEIGEDVMTSRHVAIRSGDGHGIFDVISAKKKNFLIDESDEWRRLVIGNHVWIGYEGMIIGPSNIGSGCIVAAKSLLKGKYPNNCLIGGE